MNSVERSGPWARLVRSRTWRRLARRRLSIQTVLDVGAWVVALGAAMLVRFEFDFGAFGDWSVPEAMAIAAALQVGCGLAFGLYQGRWRFGSFEAMAGLARTVLVATVVFVVLNRLIFDPRLVPVSVSVAAGVSPCC